LGSQVNCDSGISAACFRTGKTLYCADAETDGRVDPAACRLLQVRSILVLPLLAKGRVVGIFEVFSRKPNSFDELRIRALEELVADVMKAEESSPAVGLLAPAEIFPIAKSEHSQRPIALAKSARLRALAIPLAIILAAVVFAVAVWSLANRIRSKSVVGQQPIPNVGATTSSSVPTAATSVSASVTVPRQNSEEARSETRTAEGKDVTFKRFGSPNGDENAAPVPLRPAPESLGDRTQLQPPQVSQLRSVAPDDPSQVAAIMATSVNLPPEPHPTVSQGVSGRKLIRQIKPVYPQTAQMSQQEGDVVLRAVVGEDGRVRDVQVISGPQAFYGPATRAVKDWQYEPAYLNGKAIEWTTQITLKFRLR
jgi:protein TonB